jgi:hypothetical protein
MEDAAFTFSLVDLLISGSARRVIFGLIAFFACMWWLGHLDRKIEARLKKQQTDGPFMKAWLLMSQDPKALAIYLSGRILAVSLLIGKLLGACVLMALLITAPAEAAQPGPRTGSVKQLPLPSQYDAQIRRAAEDHLPMLPWVLYWGQLMQESGMNPQARSPVGAMGLAQFMPATWREISAALLLGAAQPTDIAPAIVAGAYYDARLRRQWSSPRPERDRAQLMLASYNAGLGSILQSQRACGMASLYESIMACLQLITGARHAQETRGYAPAILRHARRKDAGLMEAW